MVLIAHVSDLHLGPVPFPRALALKPVLGWINWRRKWRADNTDRLERTIEAVIAARPDHVIVTGDVVELSQSAEYRRAWPVLGRFGEPSWAPGNHDVYTRAGEHLLKGGPGDLRDDFPKLSTIGPATVVTLCSGTPTWLFSAEGELGRAQLDRLDATLRHLDSSKTFPMIALHHPLVAPELSSLQRLRDAGDLLDILASTRCDIVLHGHRHRASRDTITHNGRSITQIGAASASANVDHGEEAASFNLLWVERDGETWQWRCETQRIAQRQ